MPTTTTYMGLTKPILNLEPGTWDTSLNLSLDTIDLHNHVTGNGVQIPTAGLDLDADLTFAGHAALNLKALAFTAQTSYTVARSLFVLSSDNELYWRNNSGVNVKLTSGTGLNIAAVGGLTGDYGSSGASFYYDDASETYRALQAAPLPNVWAALASGNLDLYEKLSGVANRVRLSSPASLAASYALTFPAALPGSTVMAQVSAAGAVILSNTIPNALTLSADLTLSSGVHAVVSGTGRFKHGDLVRVQCANMASFASGWTRFSNGILSTGTVEAYLSPEFDVGQRVKSVTISRQGNSSANLLITVKAANLDGSDSTLGTATVTAPTATWTDTTIDLTDTTVADGAVIVVLFTPSAAGVAVNNVRWTYDRP